MSWQSKLYQRLRDREWHTVGVLFDSIEQDIPQHTAMRRYLSSGKRTNRDIPTNTEARWLAFKAGLSIIGFEVSCGGNKRYLNWNDQIRITYIEGEQCKVCGGPVIKRGWSARVDTFICLACARGRKEIDLQIIVGFFGFPYKGCDDSSTEIRNVRSTNKVALPCEISLPADLVSSTKLELWSWQPVNIRYPDLPKPKRKRKRRAKVKRVPTPRLVAPPVIVQTPQLVKKPPQPPQPMKIVVKVPRPKPVPKPEIVEEDYAATIQTIWEAFIQSTTISNIDQNPKLRRILHRALEAGIIEEYQQMKISTKKELGVLGWPDGETIGKMLGVRGLRWIENSSLRDHQRRRWARMLMQAHTAGASGIVVLTTNGRLNEIAGEIERLLVSKQPKPQQPNRPPQPVRQRWGAPFRQAGNVLNRWFNR